MAHAGKRKDNINDISFQKVESNKANDHFPFVSDRRDIDHQSYKQFVGAGFSEFAHKAKSMQDLNRLLQEEGSRVIFTTLHKLKPKSWRKIIHTICLLLLTRHTGHSTRTWQVL